MLEVYAAFGNPDNPQDPLPADWARLSKEAGPLPEKLGIVEPGRLYRSAIVWAHQVPELRARFGVHHIVSLLAGDWLSRVYDDPNVTIHQMPFHQRRELTFDRIRRIVGVLDDLEGPTLVHCLKGKTRTGMVCAGYRVLHDQVGPLRAIVESMRYGNGNLSSFREMLRYSADCPRRGNL